MVTRAMKNRYLVVPSFFLILVPFLAVFVARAFLRPCPDYESLSRIPWEPVHNLKDTDTRQRLWLDSRDWEFRLEREKTWQAGMSVPACWNAIKGLENFEGRAFYRKRFLVPLSFREKSVFLIFRGVSYRARILLNGKEVGIHEGGYTQFQFDVGKILNPGQENILELEVDNRLGMKTLPGRIKGWKHVGGIYREVYLEARPEIHFRDLVIRARPAGAGDGGMAWIRWSISDREKSRNILCRFIFRDDAGELIRDPVNTREEELAVSFDSIRPWSPDTPFLYAAEAELWKELNSGEELLDRVLVIFGFKRIEVRGRKIFLNGRPFKVRGVSRHEDAPGYFKTQPAWVIKNDLRMIKGLGANTLRLGHYPGHPYLLDLCDRYGLLVWEELPAWGGVSSDYADEDVLALGRSQIEEMIQRDKNHVCVGFWGVADEICTDTDAGARFVRDMVGAARELDPSRLVSAASDRYERDKSIPFLDVAAFNAYHGWYKGRAEGFRDEIQKLSRAFPDKPVLYSEYGAGAQAGWHGASGDIYTEENQARVLMKAGRIIELDEDCAGGIIWLFSDFQDEMRIFNPKPFFNQKGLVNYHRDKKLAYEIVKKMYQAPEVEPEFPGWSRIRPRVLAGSLAGLTLVMILGSLFSRIPKTWRILFPDIPRYSRLWLRAGLMSVISGIYLHLIAKIGLLAQPLALPGLPVDALFTLRLVFNSAARPVFFMACVFFLWLIFSLVLEALAERKGASGSPDPSDSRSMFEVSLGVGDPLAWILPYPLVFLFPFLLPLALALVYRAPYMNIPFTALGMVFSASLLIIFIKTWLSLRIRFYGSAGQAFSCLVIYEITGLIIAVALFGFLLL
jgi:beta-glucuronidase